MELEGCTPACWGQSPLIGEGKGNPETAWLLFDEPLVRAERNL